MSKHMLYLLTCFILAGFLIGCNNSGSTNTPATNPSLSKQQNSLSNISLPYSIYPDYQFTQNMNTIFAGQTFNFAFVVTGKINEPTVISFENSQNNPDITYNPSSCTITQESNFCVTTVQADLSTPPINRNPGYTTNIVSSGTVIESLTFAVEQPLLIVTPKLSPEHIAVNGQSTIGFTLYNVPNYNNDGTIIVNLNSTTPGIVSIPTVCKIAYANGVITTNTCANIPITGIANGRTSIIASSPNFKDTVSHFITVGTEMNYTYVTNNTSNNISVYTSLSGLLNPLNSLTQISGNGPNWTIFDTTGNFAYVTNTRSNSVSMYKTGTNGSLIPLSTPIITTDNSPITITFEATGRFAYVSNQNSNSVSMYKVDQTTGILTPLSPNASITAGSAPVGVTADPSGQYLYVTNYQSNNISIYQINQITGGLTSLLSTSIVAVRATPFELVFDPAGKYAYVPNSILGSISVFSFDPKTGMLTLVSEYKTASSKLDEIRFSPNGKYAYLTDQLGSSVLMFSVNPDSGALTALNPPKIFSGNMPIGLTFDSTGQYLYVTNAGDNTISMYNFNPNSGILTPIGIVSSGVYPIAITVN